MTTGKIIKFQHSSLQEEFNFENPLPKSLISMEHLNNAIDEALLPEDLAVVSVGRHGLEDPGLFVNVLAVHQRDHGADPLNFRINVSSSSTRHRVSLNRVQWRRPTQDAGGIWVLLIKQQSVQQSRSRSNYIVWESFRVVTFLLRLSLSFCLLAGPTCWDCWGKFQEEKV